MRIFLAAVLVIAAQVSAFALVIDGYAYGTGLTDHSNIEIRFIAKSPSAVTTSGFTNASGQFTINVASGIYDIEYAKAGFQTISMLNVLVSITETFDDQTLSVGATQNVSGSVQGSWINTTIYNVTGDITVPAGQTLTIEKGTTIRFPGFHKLTVDGKLIATGTASDRITFTSGKVSKASGDWAGIVVNGSADTTRFDYCTIEYGASSGNTTALLTNYGKCVVRNSIVRASAYGGMAKRGGFLKIMNTEVTNCAVYGISGSDSGDIIILDSHIHHIDLIGIALTLTGSLIKGNQVNDNGSNGISLWGTTLIEKNLVYNNAHGVFVSGSKPVIKNNTIFNNNKGIRFYDNSTTTPSAIITSNIISGNTTHAIYSEGIYGAEKIEYNLMYGNGSISNQAYPAGTGAVITTNAQGHPADTYYNIFLNPNFLSTSESSGSFMHLDPGSPAINSGDPQYKLCDNNAIDCGARYHLICPQTITFTLGNQVWGTAPFQLNGTVDSNLPIKYTSDNSAVAQVAGNTITITGVGTATITAERPATDFFQAATSVPRTITVSKAPQVISFSALTSRVFSEQPFALVATSDSGLPLVFQSSDPSIASISGTQVTIHGVGETTITATQAGDAHFLAATPVERILTVNKAPQVITFPSLSTKTYDDADFQLTATSSSNLAVSYISDNIAVATVSGSTVTIHGVGTAIFTAAQAGDNNYLAATQVTRTLTVEKANQTITLTAISAKTFGDADFELTATSSAGLPVTFASDNSSVASITGTSVTIHAAGSSLITASQAGNVNYNAASVSHSLVVNKKNQTIAFGPIDNKKVGDPDVTLSATATSGLEITYTSSNAQAVLVAGQVLSFTGAGDATITASQAGNSNYNPATTSQSLTVTKRDQTITFADLSAKVAGGPPFELTATSTSNLPVSFSTPSDKITISGTTVTLKDPGSVTIVASQSGNFQFNAALGIARTFCINPAKPAISDVGTAGQPTLESSAVSGNQWFLNGTAINGGTSRTLVVASPGTYTVKSSVDGCESEMSQGLTLIVTGASKYDLSEDKVITYPNPVQSTLHLLVPKTITGNVQGLNIVGSGGKSATATYEWNGDEIVVDVGGLSPGYYWLRLVSSGIVSHYPFIKK